MVGQPLTEASSPFNSTHGHKIADKYSIKTKKLGKCINVFSKLLKKNYK